MGLFNPRAICPNCGAKIHTQKRGWERGWYKRNPLRHKNQRTGRECPQCHVGLTGNVGTWDNKAELADAPD